MRSKLARSHADTVSRIAAWRTSSESPSLSQSRSPIRGRCAGPFPKPPMFSQEGSDSQCYYPSHVARALQETIMDTVVHQSCEVRGPQIIGRLSPNCIQFQNLRVLYGMLTAENSCAGCQPVCRYQLLAGFMRDYKSTVTGSGFMEARSEGSLNLIRDSLRLSEWRPELEQIGNAPKLTINAARFDKNKELFSMEIITR